MQNALLHNVGLAYDSDEGRRKCIAYLVGDENTIPLVIRDNEMYLHRKIDEKIWLWGHNDAQGNIAVLGAYLDAAHPLELVLFEHQALTSYQDCGTFGGYVAADPTLQVRFLVPNFTLYTTLSLPFKRTIQCTAIALACDYSGADMYSALLTQQIKASSKPSSVARLYQHLMSELPLTTLTGSVKQYERYSEGFVHLQLEMHTQVFDVVTNYKNLAFEPRPGMWMRCLCVLIGNIVD